MVTKKINLPPFLSLHTIAAIRGNGLHPELLALFKRLAAGVDGTLPRSLNHRLTMALLSCSLLIRMPFLAVSGSQ